jgi:hypothetical protein
MRNTQSLFLVLFLQYFTLYPQINANFGFINVAPGTGQVDPGPWPSVAGMEFKPFKANGVSAQPSAFGRFAFTGWPTGATNGVDDELQLSGAMSGLHYYELALKALSGYTFYVSAIRFTVRRSSTGCRHFMVRSSDDDFSSGLAASTGTNSQISVRPGNYFFWNFDSTATSYDQKGCVVFPNLNCSGSLIFRFYAWNAETTNGSFSIDNVTVSGFMTSSLTTGAPEAVAETSTVLISFDVRTQQYCLSNGLQGDWFLMDNVGRLLKQEKQSETLAAVEAGDYYVYCIHGGRLLYCRRLRP